MTPNRLAKKTLHINIELEQALIGLSTGMKPFQVAWHLNTAFGWDFKREEDLVLILRKNQPLCHFQKFSHELLELETIVYLVANNGSFGTLIPEYKQLDYFLLFDEGEDMFDGTILTRHLKKLNLFGAVLPIEVNDKLRSREHLVF